MMHQNCTLGLLLSGEGGPAPLSPSASPSCSLSLSLLSLCYQNRHARGPSSLLLPGAQQGHTAPQNQCTRFWSLPSSQPQPCSRMLSVLKLCRVPPFIWDLGPDGTDR